MSDESKPGCRRCDGAGEVKMEGPHDITLEPCPVCKGAHPGLRAVIYEWLIEQNNTKHAYVDDRLDAWAHVILDGAFDLDRLVEMLAAAMPKRLTDADLAQAKAQLLDDEGEVRWETLVTEVVTLGKEHRECRFDFPAVSGATIHSVCIRIPGLKPQFRTAFLGLPLTPQGGPVSIAVPVMLGFLERGE